MHHASVKSRRILNFGIISRDCQIKTSEQKLLLLRSEKLVGGGGGGDSYLLWVLFAVMFFLWEEDAVTFYSHDHIWKVT